MSTPNNNAERSSERRQCPNFRRISWKAGSNVHLVELIYSGTAWAGSAAVHSADTHPTVCPLVSEWRKSTGINGTPTSAKLMKIPDTTTAPCSPDPKPARSEDTEAQTLRFISSTEVRLGLFTFPSFSTGRSWKILFPEASRRLQGSESTEMSTLTVWGRKKGSPRRLSLADRSNEPFRPKRTDPAQFFKKLNCQMNSSTCHILVTFQCFLVKHKRGVLLFRD